MWLATPNSFFKGAGGWELAQMFASGFVGEECDEIHTSIITRIVQRP